MRAPCLVLLVLLLAPPAVPADDDVEQDPQVRRAVRALREDRSLKVRTQAAFVLAQRSARVAVPALCAALAEDSAPAVRVAAATALGRIGDSASLESLRSAQARDPDHSVRDAAGRALAELQQGVRSVSIEPVRGDDIGAHERSLLFQALTTHLQKQGFAIIVSGGKAGHHLKPSILRYDVVQSGSVLRVEVRASLVAVDRHGRIATMVEGGARARTSTPGAKAAPVAAQAFEAAARSLSEDLANRLLDPR